MQKGDLNPYQLAIHEFSKIPKERNPYEKLSTILMMYNLMRFAIVDYHQGKEELGSMDDELPILIFIISRCKVKNLSAHLNFINDYVNHQGTMETEERIMMNLIVSFAFIVDEWSIEEFENPKKKDGERNST